MSGSWERIYTEQGRVQLDILDTALEARDLFLRRGHEKVLDLGCGTGRHTLMLSDAGLKVHACDISETGLEITRKLMEETGFHEVEYSLQDMYDLTLQDEMFDAILCIWVQGHGVRDQVQKGIGEAFRILRSGGTFFTDFVIREDVTYGVGEEIAPDTFVGGRPGEEGIPHYYTTEDELREFFHMFSQVETKPKIYRFHDDEGNEHVIEAVVVVATK